MVPPMTPTPSYDLDAVRRQVPLLATHVPMNACSHAPQSDRTREAAEAYLDSWQRDGMDWDTWIAAVDGARVSFARMVGGAPEDVAVAGSVSQATASVATGLDFSGSRHRVVVSAAEFPTVSHVWLAQERLGAEVRRVEADGESIPLERYAEAIDDRTLVVSAARAWFRNGWKQDTRTIAELAHRHGALLFVDAYQALGSESFDAPSSGADFVASGNLKFLMGIPGIAFLWVRPGVAEHLEPAVTGWFGRRDPYAFDPDRLDWADGARRLDLGTPPILEAYVAHAGMEWLREIGLDAVQAWTRELRRRLVEGGRARGLSLLAPGDDADATPTTAFAVANAHHVERALRARGVIASARGPAIRLAPHFYSSFEDVDRALEALSEVSGIR
jgi:selenocysteine lyase/cysteine desulfurase